MIVWHEQQDREGYLTTVTLASYIDTSDQTVIAHKIVDIYSLLIMQRKTLHHHFLLHYHQCLHLVVLSDESFLMLE